jgi:uncharacterized protein YegJ (DUF2314 family)
MMRRSWLSVDAATCMLMLAACARGGERGDLVTTVSADDSKVNAAIAQAQATLPVFWTRYDARDPAASEFRIKAKLSTPHGGVEHIWVDVTGHDPAGARGTLANDPEDLGALKFGSPVTVEPARISDWMYLKGGKIYGGYTIRALLDRGSPEERRKVEAMLPPTPLEPVTN